MADYIDLVHSRYCNMSNDYLCAPNDGPALDGKVAWLSHDRYFRSEAPAAMLKDWIVELQARGCVPQRL